MLEQKFDHESKPIKVGAIFDDKTQAEKALSHILSESDISFSQMDIISPGESQNSLGSKLEPEQKAIGKDLLRAHYWFCIYGAMAGFCISLILYAFNLPMIESSAGIISLAFTSVGALTGLMIANIYAIKPTRDFVITQTRDAHSLNKWSVIVHVKNKLQMKKTTRILDHHTQEISVAI